jgi:hypothetical protein
MNKFIRNNFIAICITLAIVYAFNQNATIFQQESKPKVETVVPINQETNKTFIDYWKNNKIEITKYEIKEDSISVGEGSLTFSIAYASGINKTDSIQTLHSDFTEKIQQENNDHSTMTSVYLPLNLTLRPHAIQVINTAQEFAENSFLELSQIPKYYEILAKNTFKGKTKEHFLQERKNLEDELWAKIRTNPNDLPTGDIEVIPSFAFWQSVRKSPKIYEAKAELTDYVSTEFTGKKLKIYTLDYPDLKRNLSIVFESQFPFEIVGWKKVIDGKVVIGRISTKGIGWPT